MCGFIAPSEDVISDGTESGELFPSTLLRLSVALKELTPIIALAQRLCEQEQNKEQNLQKTGYH